MVPRKSSKVVKNSKNSNDCVVTLVKNYVQTPGEKCNRIGELIEKQELEKLIRSILSPHYQEVSTLVVQQQRNSCDCGIFALAFAPSLVFGQNPEHLNFNVGLMRPHLCACLRNRYIETFPVC